MHWFVRDTTALVLTVLVAECSYHVLELPFLLLKERFSTIKSGPASLPKFAKIR
jgi:peptidoglycan/LPS O-acetylase OafA/YrhL